MSSSVRALKPSPAPWYAGLCSPDLPDGPHVLKRVAGIRDGRVMLEGDGPRALDSRFVGPVRTAEFRQLRKRSKPSHPDRGNGRVRGSTSPTSSSVASDLP